jgi:hypothetical protein
MKRRSEIVPQTVFEDSDKDGTEYTIKDRFGRVPDVQVFYADRHLTVRQENHKSVDVLGLSMGQAYDLLVAVSKALDIPVKTF